MDYDPLRVLISARVLVCVLATKTKKGEAGIIANCSDNHNIRLKMIVTVNSSLRHGRAEATAFLWSKD